jgi:formamidopyrimidine-DNA glycosylase
MPELPEVEITRRQLAAVVDGATMVDVTVTHERTARHNSGPREVEERLTGRRIVSLDRTGKFLHSDLDDGQLLVAHLGMTGRFTVDGEDEPHTHLRLLLDNGHLVRFIDPRTFGFVAVYDAPSSAPGLARLGADAWLTPPGPAELTAALQGRTAPIKALLLDQGLISGLGNIYADEALHGAAIHPLRPGGTLTVTEIEALLEAISKVLVSAIHNEGTSLDDRAYLLPDGRAGENLGQLQVYGRTDQPCLECGTPIQQVSVRSRSTHFCPTCQAERQ